MNQPQLRRRAVANTHQLPHTLSSLLRRLYASRGVTDATGLERSAAALCDHRQLKGIEGAVSLLQWALAQDKVIIIVGDFDADGATSTALVMIALRSMGARRISYLVPSRFTEGYGLTPAVVEQAKLRGADLIVTVDTGVTSQAGVQAAQAYGMQVLITDHHLPGPELPAADAIVNPNLPECPFPSKTLAGVGVAFYLMIALRAQLRQAKWFMLEERPEPNLAELLDLVALGTVADVVPLDTNNRILVYQGLHRIRAGRCRPGITALLSIAQRDARHLVASDLGFSLGPRLNAAGRLEDMSLGIELLLCDDQTAANSIVQRLEQLNQTRRAIEQQMQQQALAGCQQISFEQSQLPLGLALYQPNWHQGVVGIVAARLKARFYRPVIAFAPAGNGLLKGSGRSIPGLHLRDVLAQIECGSPGLMCAFGGHALAVGLSIKVDHFETFQRCFADQVAQQLDQSLLQEVLWSDGELTSEEMTLETAIVLREAGPWGQAFPEPLFDGVFRLQQQRLLAGKHLKMVVAPIAGGPLLDAIAFNVDITQWPDASAQIAQLAYHLDINTFRGQRTLQLVVERIWGANQL